MSRRRLEIQLGQNQTRLDPGNMTIGEIKSLTLDAAGWALLLAQEEQGKRRRGVIKHAQAMAQFAEGVEDVEIVEDNEG